MLKNILLIVSIILYGCLGWKSLAFICCSLLITYFLGKKIANNKEPKVYDNIDSAGSLKEKDKADDDNTKRINGKIAKNNKLRTKNKISSNNKVYMLLAVTINLLLLIFFKFLPYEQKVIPILGALTVPIGISYYTLQLISYIVDIYKNKYKPETNIIDFALFVLFIPHLYIGPIYRYNDFKKQISKPLKITADNLLNGSIRILWGLLKKLVIASRLSVVIGTISSDTATYYGAYALFAMLLYSFQLYSDFSGGIDMVLGISKIFGINLIENFNTPFMSQTVKEFWNRWHISLGTWLRDYIYIPLGGNRKGKIRKAINVLITFTISGFWHGINYLLWGVLNGIFVILGDRLKSRFKWLNRAITFIIISFLWAFFIWPDTVTALKMITSVFVNFNLFSLCNQILDLGLVLSDWIVLLLAIIILITSDIKYQNLTTKVKELSVEKKLIIICTFILVVLVFGMYGIGFNATEFIYSKF